jgi:NADH:ubiquinone oxidoreductase subunit 5 (subunit L)/multisubunit Na+/H+ antiporter MnhA subunit
MRLGHTVLSNLASGLYNRLLRNVALSGLFVAGLYVTGFLHNPFILNQLLSAGTKSGVLTAAFALFGFTIVQSFFTMQFLGLYGVFMCQLVALVFLWVALCLNAECVAFCGLDYKIVLFKWFTLSPHIVVNFELYVDLVSISFAILTTSIAVFVLIYAFAYFRYEPNVDRLILMLCAFVWSMVLLVLSGNMFVLLLG